MGGGGEAWAPICRAAGWLGRACPGRKARRESRRAGRGHCARKGTSLTAGPGLSAAGRARAVRLAGGSKGVAECLVRGLRGASYSAWYWVRLVVGRAGPRGEFGPRTGGRGSQDGSRTGKRFGLRKEVERVGPKRGELGRGILLGQEKGKTGLGFGEGFGLGLVFLFYSISFLFSISNSNKV